MRKSFEPGAVFFDEGAASDFVVRVISGTVEVFRDLGGQTIVLGTVGEGEFLGEMGVIENQPRSAGARAKSAVEVEMLTAEDFLDRVSSDPATARELIRRLSARLRDADNRIVEAVQSPGPATARPPQGSADDKDAAAPSPPADAGDDRPPLTLAPASEPLQSMLGEGPVSVAPMPFIVGRPIGSDEKQGPIPLDLSIPDTPPYRLSRAHFMLLEEYGAPVVRDLCSTLGTIVNGRSIGQDFATDVAELASGDNEIVAGGVDSPYRFSVRVG